MKDTIRTLVWILAAILVGIVVGIIELVFANSPQVLIGPSGAITYVYPGTNGGPTVIMPPTGLPTYV
jgi:hypothetical protein